MSRSRGSSPLRRTRSAEAAEEAAPLGVSVHDVGGEDRDDERHQRYADMWRVGDELPHRSAEEVADTGPRAGPEQPRGHGVGEEAPRVDAADAGQRGGNGIQARQKFCDEQRLQSPGGEHFLRPADA
jgi:hypothetical protein